MEWSAPCIVLAARPHGEGDAVAAVFSRDHGVFRGLVRGGLSRARASVWQTGNLIEGRWVARLPDQLGSLTAELVHPSAALAMEDPLSLAVLTASCAVAEGALAERQAQPRIFQGLLHLLARLGADALASLAELALWEVAVLEELGYGLDLSACTLGGATDDLAFVSPRTGRAVSRQAAGAWAGRLLKLPAFLRPDNQSGETPSAAASGEALALTGHFLAKNAFGSQNQPLPQARQMLQDRLLR